MARHCPLPTPLAATPRSRDGCVFAGSWPRPWHDLIPWSWLPRFVITSWPSPLLELVIPPQHSSTSLRPPVSESAFLSLFFHYLLSPLWFCIPLPTKTPGPRTITVPWKIPLILLFLSPFVIRTWQDWPLLNLPMYVVIELKQLSIDRNILQNSYESLRVYEHKKVFNKDTLCYFPSKFIFLFPKMTISYHILVHLGYYTKASQTG